MTPTKDEIYAAVFRLRDMVDTVNDLDNAPDDAIYDMWLLAEQYIKEHDLKEITARQERDRIEYDSHD